MLLYSLFKPFYLFNCLLLVLKKPGLISVLIFLLHTLYNDTCNLTNPLFFHGNLMFSCFQPSTRVSRRSPWRPTHHRRDRTSHHGTAHHRATRSLIWVCILAASHPRKPGWAFEAKVTEQRRCVYDCTPLDHLLCVGFRIRVLFLFMFLLIIICFFPSSGQHVFWEARLSFLVPDSRKASRRPQDSAAEKVITSSQHRLVEAKQMSSSGGDSRATRTTGLNCKNMLYKIQQHVF